MCRATHSSRNWFLSIVSLPTATCAKDASTAACVWACVALPSAVDGACSITGDVGDVGDASDGLRGLEGLDGAEACGWASILGEQSSGGSLCGDGDTTVAALSLQSCTTTSQRSQRTRCKLTQMLACMWCHWMLSVRNCPSTYDSRSFRHRFWPGAGACSEQISSWSAGRTSADMRLLRQQAIPIGATVLNAPWQPGIAQGS